MVQVKSVQREDGQTGVFMGIQYTKKILRFIKGYKGMCEMIHESEEKKLETIERELLEAMTEAQTYHRKSGGSK